MDKSQEIKDFIKNQIATSKYDLRGAIKDQKVANYINTIGKHFGYDYLSMDDNELFNELSGFVRQILKESKNKSMKNILKETDSIITNVNMLNYQDEDVIKLIKSKFTKEFKDYTLEKIVNDGDGPFYTMEVTATVSSDIKSDLEIKRFNLVQIMYNFRAAFLTSISEILPVINVNIASYQFTKNSDKIKFGVKFLLSNTNNRDWVSGTYKTPDEETKDKELKESKLYELRVKSNLIPIGLMDAIHQFKANQINRRMLETAIKACKRNELEKYVMGTLNLKFENPSEDEDENKDTKKEEIEETVDVQEPVQADDNTIANQVFQEFQYDFDWERDAVKYMRDLKLPKENIIAVIDKLHGKEYFNDGGSVFG